MNNTQITNETPKNGVYTGSKTPMVSITMLKTSKAITGALNRIETRRTWIDSRKVELMEAFNSNDPTKKKDAYEEAKHLATSLSSLQSKEDELKSKLPAIQKTELAELEDLQFPDFSI